MKGTKASLLAVLAVIVCVLLPTQAAVAEPKRDILGLHLDMTREDARKRLQEIGTFEREERKEQEIWQVRDPRLSHVVIGASKEGKLRYITAVAREDKEAKPVPYGKIGDLKQARQAGDPKIKNFQYQWELPATKVAPAMLVIAAGRDEKHLTTHSLRRLGE